MVSNYNPEIHHRRSIRLKGYDYSQPGLYFITICTHQRKWLFGQVQHGAMELNHFGEIADAEWLKTAEIRNNVELLEYVIMPNHIHGIILLNDLENDNRRGTMHRAPTTTPHRAPTTTPHRAPTYEQFGKPTPNTIPTIIRGYKSSVTKQINDLRNVSGAPVWQRNYYEHIIRDENALNRICAYIQTNPVKWKDERYFAKETNNEIN